MENYFTERAIQLVKGPKYRSLHPYEKLSETPLGWAKNENWKIAREMTLDELNGTDLLAFLKDKL